MKRVVSLLCIVMLIFTFGGCRQESRDNFLNGVKSGRYNNFRAYLNNEVETVCLNVTLEELIKTLEDKHYVIHNQEQETDEVYDKTIVTLYLNNEQSKIKAEYVSVGIIDIDDLKYIDSISYQYGVDLTPKTSSNDHINLLSVIVSFFDPNIKEPDLINLKKEFKNYLEAKPKEVKNGMFIYNSNVCENTIINNIEYYTHSPSEAYKGITILPAFYKMYK